MAQCFGGNWTEEKLEKVSKYLSAYTTIMSKQPFTFAYIDAFAGTGYREVKNKNNSHQFFFPELAESEPQAFLEGSTRIALKVDPSFQKFIFIEADSGKKEILQRMVDENFPEKKEHVKIHCGDANDILQKMCKNVQHWNTRRAVLFLDPFGMQVEWATIEAVAGTKAIDMWLLFPIGACNRMLPQNGKAISDGWEDRLNIFFGENDWKNVFYRKDTMRGLFTDESLFRKIADFQDIADYFIKRLQTVFYKVAEHPCFLYNSKNVPLFMLCFAAGNPRGAPIAVKIANHILKGFKNGRSIRH